MKSTGRNTRAKVYLYLVILTLASCMPGGKADSYRDFKIGEDIELRYWAPWWTYVSGTDHAGEYPLYQELEKLTGVRVVFDHPPFNISTAQQLELVRNSDDMPDIIEWNWFRQYPGGADAAIADGTIEQLDELLLRYAPNLWRIITENEEAARWITTADGSFYAFPYLRMDPSLRITTATVLKADWLEAVDMSVPETLDQWHEVLTAFKEHDFGTIGYREEYPLLVLTEEPLMKNTLIIHFLEESNIFANAFGVAHGFYSSEGTYRYGPIQPEYREMLQMLADWQAEWLIHPNLTQPDRATTFSDMLIKSGVWLANTWIAGVASSFRLVAAPSPRREGTVPLGQMIRPVYGGSRAAAISAGSSNKIEAVRWLDLAYSEAGSLLFNFGIEGETYRMESRRPVLTEEITSDIRRNFENGSPWANTLLRYARGFSGGPFVLSEELISQYSRAAESDSSLDPPDSGVNAQIVPDAVLSFYPEKRREYEHIMDEIGQFHLRNFVAFVSGERSLSEFQDFVLQIQRMGIGEAEEILNTAWREFYSKPVW